MLAEHPYVLVVLDDYYSFLSRRPFRSPLPTGHRRWALVRSVSKFLGPDLCLAVCATDPETAGRLALRLSPGTTWVSHLLQRLAHGVLADDASRALVERAGEHYAARNAQVAALLTAPTPATSYELVRSALVDAVYDFATADEASALPAAASMAVRSASSAPVEVASVWIRRAASPSRTNQASAVRKMEMVTRQQLSAGRGGGGRRIRCPGEGR